jgi:hypothetical protein
MLDLIGTTVLIAAIAVMLNATITMMVPFYFITHGIIFARLARANGAAVV